MIIKYDKEKNELTIDGQEWIVNIPKDYKNSMIIVKGDDLPFKLRLENNWFKPGE